MLGIITQLASAEATASDPIAGLGINGMLLAFQLIAFLILIVVLNKFILPVFIRIVDKRQAMIEESTKAAVNAEKNAADAEAKIKKILADARKEAADIVTTAKDESAAMVADAETKASENAKRIVDQAHESIQKDIESAKKELHNQTIELVALATEKVVGKAVDAKVDEKLIASSLREAK